MEQKLSNSSLRGATKLWDSMKVSVVYFCSWQGVIILDPNLLLLFVFCYGLKFGFACYQLPVYICKFNLSSHTEMLLGKS